MRRIPGDTPEASGDPLVYSAPGSGGSLDETISPRSGDVMPFDDLGGFPGSVREGPAVESCLESGIPAGGPNSPESRASFWAAQSVATGLNKPETPCPAGDQVLSDLPGRSCFWGRDRQQPLVLCGPSKKRVTELEGKGILEMGPKVLQWVLEVFPLRSQTMGEGGSFSLFPLPTSRTSLQTFFPSLETAEVSWLICICVSLNSIWGGQLLYEGKVSQAAANCLKHLVEDITRLKALTGHLERFEWNEFFKTRAIDYKGDEVKTARRFRWENIAPALPAEIGRVPLGRGVHIGGSPLRYPF